MNPILPDGTYRLTVDVVNPDPSRSTVLQRKIWTRQPVWPAQMIVQLRRKTKSGEAFLTVPGDESYLDQDDERFALLSAHLTPVDETPSLWLERVHGGHAAIDILDALVASGKITLADVQRIGSERSGLPSALPSGRVTAASPKVRAKRADGLFPIGAAVVLIESGATGKVVRHVKATRDDHPAKKAHKVRWDKSGSESYVRPGRLQSALPSPRGAGRKS